MGPESKAYVMQNFFVQLFTTLKEQIQESEHSSRNLSVPYDTTFRGTLKITLKINNIEN